MATINHKTYNEGTETFKDFSVYDGKDTLIFKVDGSAQSAAVTGTLAVSGAATFDTTTLVVDAANNRVGVGTATPSTNLDVVGEIKLSSDLYMSNDRFIRFVRNSGSTSIQTLGIPTGTDDVRLLTTGDFNVVTGGLSSLLTVKASGNVGIGTSAPPADTNLTVLGNFQSGFYRDVTSGDRGYVFNLGAKESSGALTNAVSVIGVLESTNASGYMLLQTRSANVLSTRVRIDADGLKFGSDTLQVNALDDYEEGTFNFGIAFGGGSTGITYNHRTGTYTKIGRQVTVNGLISLTDKGSDTGDVRITGLPFTIPNSVGNYSAPSFQLFNITFANQVFGYGVINTTQISINEMTEAGVVTTLTNADFANNSEVIIGLTYFV